LPVSVTPLNESLDGLLRQVSRSFYLTLRILPAAVQPQIGLAYLLARTADTIADTDLLPAEQRLTALQAYRERLLCQNSVTLDFGALAGNQATPAEAQLLQNAESALAELQTFSTADQHLIREVLGTITSGQILDLRRFSGLGTPASHPANTRIIALETGRDLDDYIYRVAGCVGEFWTKICRAHVFPEARLDDHQLMEDGIRFGKGLQLVNILRDLPEDLKKSRCYLPMQRLDEARLFPEILLSPVKQDEFRVVYHEYLDKAEGHLAAGWRYTNALPYGQFRVRLACAWPVLIGLRTIKKLRAASVSRLQQRVKLSRGEVWWVIFISSLMSPLPFFWRRLSGVSVVKAVASHEKLA
jgi:farnesyl-diphosphate farnesyltransferase